MNLLFTALPSAVSAVLSCSLPLQCSPLQKLPASFVKQRETAPLCLCFMKSVVHCIIFGQEVEIFFSTPSLQLDLLIKRLRKNTRTFTWLIRLRWSTFLRKLWSPWNLHMVTTRRFHRGHQKVCQVRVDWAPQRVRDRVGNLVTVSRNATKGVKLKVRKRDQ